MTDQDIREAIKSTKRIKRGGVVLRVCKLPPSEFNSSVLLRCRATSETFLFYCPADPLNEIIDWAFKAINGGGMRSLHAQRA